MSGNGPANFKGVMVSSTFKDLEEHRSALMQALRKERLFSIGMEDYVLKFIDDIISSSLNMVCDGSAYIGLIGHRYGQIPECAARNPHGYSVTRLEYEEAQRLGRPTLIFIMGDNHPVKKGEVETDPEKMKKLEEFREVVKKNRIYEEFQSLEEFTQKAIHAVANLSHDIYDHEQEGPIAGKANGQDPNKPAPIPRPPAFHAVPPYIGSHNFVGRKAQLDDLNDWANPANPHPVLLYEAIGGTGKSMLTWEWATKHAPATRGDWAGRFWYSFYEKGAEMANFCRQALAYITVRPAEDFKKMKTPELGDALLRHLNATPWLIVFDGLERVLVAYHRFDAAQISDEEAGEAVDQIASRDACDAIRPEDGDLLRALATASPSKLLLTTRLVPQALFNSSKQIVPGVLHVRLPGLRPLDAEALFRACGVTGDSNAIQNYLQTHCDCHPLVIGVLAGLINNYLLDRGNFDAWAMDPDYGLALNLAELDLVQKRNHILKFAIESLSTESRQLLSTLALLSEAVDYPTLCALNPLLPPEPEKPELPPRKDGQTASERKEEHQRAIEEYEKALKERLKSPQFSAAKKKLPEIVRDLESRGLLQYDRSSKRHDLHPVVRGVAAGGLGQGEKERYGQKVVDHFSSQPHNPYEEAESIEDLRDGLNMVHTLLQMGRFQKAIDVYRGDFSQALLFNLEVHAEVLSLLRPFFSLGWGVLPKDVDDRSGAYLVNDAGNALFRLGVNDEALKAYSAGLEYHLREENLVNLFIILANIGSFFSDENRLARAERCGLLALDLAGLLGDMNSLFRVRLSRFDQLSDFGRFDEAEKMWRLLDPMGRDWPRNLYRPGDAEQNFAWFCFRQGKLEEEHLCLTEKLACKGKDRWLIRNLHHLRGRWFLEQGEFGPAADSLHEAVRMAREAGVIDGDSIEAETLLALSQFHLGRLADPAQVAERLAEAKRPYHLGLAKLWKAISEIGKAEKHALAAYKWAWADGEPYVRRYELNKARALILELGEEIPDLPAYDPARDEKLPWEDKVAEAIEKLRAENEAKKAAEAGGEK